VTTQSGFPGGTAAHRAPLRGDEDADAVPAGHALELLPRQRFYGQADRKVGDAGSSARSPVSGNMVRIRIRAPTLILMGGGGPTTQREQSASTLFVGV